MGACGQSIVDYSYTAWGQMLFEYRHPSSDPSEFSSVNPMKYRSYYYDSEINMYYLQSRYYWLPLCRFLNADLPEYAKKQKNETAGINLFAYCNNDPVNNADPTGFSKSSINDNNVEISNFIKKYKLKQNNFNCYSYVIAKYSRVYYPGSFSHNSISKYTSLKSITQFVLSDLKKLGMRGENVTNKGGANYNIKNSHSWLIALRISTSKSFGQQILNDFHFMKKNYNGSWSFKAGASGNVYKLKKGKNPSNISWNIYFKNSTKIMHHNYYKSSIVYILVTD